MDLRTRVIWTVFINLSAAITFYTAALMTTQVVMPWLIGGGHIPVHIDTGTGP